MDFFPNPVDVAKGLVESATEFVEGIGGGLVDLQETIFEAGVDLVGQLILAIVDIEVPPPETGILVNNNSRVQKIPVVYGKRRVGGVYAVPGWTSGDNNEYLHIVLVLCEGEIEAIDTVYINDIASTDSRFSGLVSVRTYTGTTSQTVDSVMNAAFPSLWPSTATLSGLAYVAIRLKWPDDDETTPPYSSFPKITADVRGKKVYDTRTATTTYSTNPAVCLRDYLTNSIYGKAIPTARLNDTAFESAADTCDGAQRKNSDFYVASTNISFDTSDDSINSATIDLSVFADETFVEVVGSASNDGFLTIVSVTSSKIVVSENVTTESAGAAITLHAAEKLFEINSIVRTDRRILDNINILRDSCRGFVSEIQGLFELIIEKDETASYTFDSSNIIGEIVTNIGGKRVKLNAATAKFINPDNDYKPDSVRYDNATLLSTDNGYPLETEINLPDETSRSRALHRCETVVKKSRETLVCTFLTTPEALKIKVGDVVYVTYSSFGWSSKKFRIINLRLTPLALVNVILTEHEPTVYDRTTQPQDVPADNTNLPSPYDVATPTGLTIDGTESQLLINSAGNVVTRAYLTWTVPADIFVRSTEIQYKKSVDSAWLPGGIVPGRNEAQAYINNLDDETNYDFRIRHVNSLGVPGDWASDTEFVEGKGAAPPDVSSFLVSTQPDGTRVFTWTVNEGTFPADVRVGGSFKIKYVSGTGGTWASMSDLQGAENLPPGIRSFESNQLAAGTYTFGIKMIDSTGNGSTNAVIVEGTLPDPRIAAAFVILNLYSDGWSGTKTTCWVDNDGYLVATDQDDWTDRGSPNTWGDWTSWAQNPNSPITYQHSTFDLGGIVSFTPLVTIVHNGDSITIEEQHSDDDVSYSSWTAVSGLITARYVRIRFSVTKATGTIIVTNGDIILSGSPVTEILEDIDTSSLAACTPTTSCSTSGYRIAAGDLRLPIAESYSVIRKVDITLQNVGSGWSWELIDKDVNVGPRIKIYNSSGTLADATIDATIQGL